MSSRPVRDAWRWSRRRGFAWSTVRLETYPGVLTWSAWLAGKIARRLAHLRGLP
jgi:hypothetical protein